MAGVFQAVGDARWLRAGALSTLLSALLILSFTLGFLPTWDAPVDAALRSWDGAAVVLAAKGLDAMGSIQWVAALLFVLLGVLVWEGRYRDAFLAGGAFVAAEALVVFLKSSFARARPLDGFIETHSASFPSGHAMRGAILAVLFAWLAWRHLESRPTARRIAVGVIATWGAAMGFSRMLLHVHWLTDVAVGSAIGVGIGGIAIGLCAPLARRVDVSAPIEVSVPVGVAATEDPARAPAPRREASER